MGDMRGLLFKFSSKLLIAFSFFFYHNSNSQTFSNQIVSAAGSWNGTLVKTINVSGLPILQNGAFELAQVNLHLGDDANTRNYGTYSITLSKGSTTINLVAIGGFPNAVIRQIDTKFRFNSFLRLLSDHGSTTQPFDIGYYLSQDNFQAFNGIDPNGTWTITITETSVASGGRFNDVDLVFRTPFTVNDYTTITSYDNCSTPYCLGTAEIIVASNNNFTPQSSDLFNTNTPTCSWNAAQNNSAWFKFIAAGPTAKITVSGITANLQILGVNAGVDENPCTAADNSVIPGGCPDSAINDTYYAPQYANGSTRNNQLNLSGLTIGETYYFLVDGTGGAVSPFYIEIEGASIDCSNCTFEPIIASNTPVCEGQSLQLTCSNGTSWLWTGPNGFTSTDQNPIVPNFSATNAGTYQVIVTQDSCQETRTLDVALSNPVVPEFTPVAPICIGQPLSALPTASLNGISGTWTPALNNNSTTTYTFTPADGSCATTASLTIVVGNNITPTFDTIAPICEGAAITPLPSTSLEGIQGTWTPALNNTQTTTYTFTPNDSSCTTAATLTITVNNNITPTFDPVAPICAGVSLPSLPTTSIEGIQGIWTPAINNTQTTTYTFTPNEGQCATAQTLTITVNDLVTPVFSYTNQVLCEGAVVILPILQTTSNNGITGTWSPASISTGILGVTTYTFTPDPGQCADSVSFTVTITPEIIPAFTPVAPICSGTTISSLPTISNNGIAGTWSPAFNNTQTTTYTFTPNEGQCASSTTLTISVTPALQGEINSAPNTICGGTATPCEYSGPKAYINELMFMPGTTFSTTGGDNTSSALQSMYNSTGTGQEWIEIYNPNPCEPLDLSCYILGANTGTSNFAAFAFPSSTIIPPLGFLTIGAGTNADINLANYAGTAQLLGSTRWHLENGCGYVLLADNTSAIVDAIYWSQNNANDLNASTTCGNSFNRELAIPSVCNLGVTSLPSAKNINSITYAGTFGAITQGPTVIGKTISRVSDGASSFVLSATGGTPTACNGICESPFVGSSACNGTATINITNGSGNYGYLWSAEANNQTTQTATGLCAGNYCVLVTDLSLNCSEEFCVTVTNQVEDIVPTFKGILPICVGETLTDLPTTSLNNIQGTWSPALNNTQTTTYTFTPNEGQCATTQTLTITVNDPVTPVFSYTNLSLCENAPFIQPLLQTVSNNGITGTWSPASISTGILGVTTYTFTPDPGQCADSVSFTVTITPEIIPAFTPVAPICSGTTISPLPTISNNGIAGTWSPAFNNTQTTTYTFTPNEGQCATAQTLTITVNDPVTPVFSYTNQVLCEGAVVILPILQTTSNNGITGTWSPASISTGILGVTTYTFTPDPGQCADSVSFTVTITPEIIPAFTPVAPICSGTTISPLPTISNNGIAGTWSPAFNNTQTTTYIFTPNDGQCAQSTTLEVVVNSNIAPVFTLPDEICEGDVIKSLPSVSDNGISGSWSPSINNTVTTTYLFTPADGQCAASYFYTLQVNPKVDVTFNFNSITTLCLGENLELPQISLNGIEGNWSPSFVDSSTPGSFQYIFVPNLLACANSYILTVVIENGPEVSLNLGCDGSVFKAIAVSATSATFQWFTAGGDALGNESEIVINSAGSYLLIATQNDCNTEIPFTIDNTFCDIPKGISPNDDGLNDTWNLTNLNVSKAQIYNRYGIEVYSKSNYTNEWGGTDKKGNTLPTGTYYFVITFENGNQKTGWVYLLREN